MIVAVAVVVPVHDEDERLGACLDALRRAADAAAVPTEVVVALDACTDASDAVAASRGVASVEVATRNVGAARHAGVLRALSAIDAPPERVWLATTDADCSVPPSWLADQLALAAAGSHAVAGVVDVLDWSEHPPEVPGRFRLAYGDGRTGGHGHVHGANLGVRADAYLAAGGFPPLAVGEDTALWRSLVATGRPLTATRSVWVTTSARRVARAPRGFAADLRGLAASG